MQPPLNVLLEAAIMHFVQYCKEPELTERRLIALHGHYGAAEVIECIELLQANGLRPGTTFDIVRCKTAPGQEETWQTQRRTPF